MNSLSLHMLLLDTIGKLKHGKNMGLTRNVGKVRSQYKKAAGLPKNASAEKLMDALRQTYADNGLSDKFDKTIQKFNLTLPE